MLCPLFSGVVAFCIPLYCASFSCFRLPAADIASIFPGRAKTSHGKVTGTAGEGGAGSQRGNSNGNCHECTSTFKMRKRQGEKETDADT